MSSVSLGEYRDPVAVLPKSNSLFRVGTPLILAAIASVLLLWGLSNKYLWQDEAATAVLAQRMLKFGRPLAYDGVNLITIDYFPKEEIPVLEKWTADPQQLVQYFLERGDFKADSSWRYHPWGQFVVAAVSLKMLGNTTLAARLPFALAGIVSVLLLYWFVLKNFDNRLMAMLAGLFLVCNAYWILHCRQCRYYSLSSLGLLLTLFSYARWQKGERWGAGVFIVAAWCWFQMDYGTWWPVMLVLFVDALWANRRNLWPVVKVGVALAATILPFIYYYELWNRRAAKPLGSWGRRYWINLYYTNDFVVPAVIVIAAVILLAWRWRVMAESERRIVAIACAIVVAFTFWVPLATPLPFVRYVILIAPVGCFLVAWVLVKACGQRVALTWALAAVFILTPWMGKPLQWVTRTPRWLGSTSWHRLELTVLRSEVFGNRPDPNRIVVDYLKKNAAPKDEILINYEDIPLMFYLPNPIRGGLAVFRVEDDAKTPPQFIVLRRSAAWNLWPIYVREQQRYQWSEISGVRAPDVKWGNFPDPGSEIDNPTLATPLYIARRVPH